jgi:YihY family inner membrane protein
MIGYSKIRMSGIVRLVNAADRLQGRQAWLAVPVATWKKFQGDRAGSLAALIAYYGFAALFPLLLVLVTVLNITLKNNPALQRDLLDSALAQYPVIGQQIKSMANLHALPATGLPLVVGLVLLLLGARGVAAAMQNALCEVWDIPLASRPGFLRSQLNAMALIVVVGAGLVLTTFLSGVAGGAAGHLFTGAGAHVGAVAVSLLLNFGMFWLGFRLATLRRVRWRDLRIGAAIAAVVWQVLQFAGGYVVAHQLRRSSELYGVFGVVLGLLAWLYLEAQVTLYAAEVDAVLTRRLWPRSLKSDKGGPVRQDEKAGTTTL